MIWGRYYRAIGLAGVLVAASLPAHAQGAGPAPGTLCGLFPLACPGPVPPPPQPLLGPPEEEVAPAPAPALKAAHRHQARKHARKPAAT